MGWLTKLFGSDKEKVTKESSGIQNTDVAPWQRPLYDEMINKAISISGTPFQGYEGPIAAEFTPDMLAAWNSIRGMQGGFQPGLDEARGAASRGAAPFDVNEFNQFRSPFTAGILDEIQRRGTDWLQQDVLPGIEDQFISAGQTGGMHSGTRERDITAQAIDKVNKNILGEQSKALESGQQQALDAYLRSKGLSLTGAQTLTGTETAGQNLGLTGANAQGAIGQLQMARDQGIIDFGKGEFTRQLQYPYQQLGALTQAGGTLPRVGSTVSSGQSTQTTNPADSGILGKAIGMGTSIAGLATGMPWMGSIGQLFGGASGAATNPWLNAEIAPATWSGASEYGYARGGRVRRGAGPLDMMAASHRGPMLMLARGGRPMGVRGAVRERPMGGMQPMVGSPLEMLKGMAMMRAMAGPRRGGMMAGAR